MCRLLVFNNNLTSIDISNNTALTAVHALGNYLSALDVSNNPEIRDLRVEENILTSVNSITGVEKTKLPPVGTSDISGGWGFEIAFIFTSQRPLGTQPPQPPPPLDPRLIAFVESLYENIQSRASDEDGMEFWVSGLQDGSHTGASTSGYFFFSDEYVGRNRTDVEFINDLYNTCMGRDADDGGMEYWLSQMAQGASRKLVLNSFLSGKEFVERCALFGVTLGRYEVHEYADVGQLKSVL